MNHIKVKQAFDEIKKELGGYWTRSDDKDTARIQKLVEDVKWEAKTQNMANKILDIDKALRRAQAAWENPTFALSDRVKMMNIFVQRVLELMIENSSTMNPVKIAKIKTLQKAMLNG